MRIESLPKFLLLASLLSSGCAFRGDLVASGALELECRDSEKAKITVVQAFQTQETLLIQGYVEPRGSSGCVDIAVLDPQGVVLAEARAPVVDHGHARPAHPPAFEAWLGVDPPRGSRLRIVHESSECPAVRSDVDIAAAERLNASRRLNPALTFDSAGYPLAQSDRPAFFNNQELTVRVDQEIELAGRRTRLDPASLEARGSTR